jgi:diadenylate cyclase
MADDSDQKLIEVLTKVAPGTALRSAIEQILRARTGALIVIGDTENVMKIANGGFELNCDFTPFRLYELAKMDGALILDDDARRVLMANVHLVPDYSVPTPETGIRHRTAERVARQTNAIAISISQKREIVSVYFGDAKYVLEDIPVVLAKANQALQTLEKYKSRLDQVSASLSALEFEDLVALSDVLTVVQRAEMVERIAKEVNRFIAELGVDGRLLGMQADELMRTVSEDFIMTIKDYSPSPRQAEKVKRRLAEISQEDLLDFLSISRMLGYDGAINILDQPVHPRGYRLLKRIPRLPIKIVNKIIDRFGSLKGVVNASIDELDEVDGVGAVRARAIQDGLKRLREHNLLERYV